MVWDYPSDWMLCLPAVAMGLAYLYHQCAVHTLKPKKGGAQGSLYLFEAKVPCKPGRLLKPLTAFMQLAQLDPVPVGSSSGI
jgi:hypothetical protein